MNPRTSQKQKTVINPFSLSSKSKVKISKSSYNRKAEALEKVYGVKIRKK